MRLHCEFSTPVARTDLDDYIRHLEINVGCYDKDGLDEYIVGKLAVDQILWMDALVDGVSLFEICDGDSQGLHEVHTILTKGKQEFRPDLKIKEVKSHVMFMYGAVFHPSIHAYRKGILDAALNLFGEGHQRPVGDGTGRPGLLQDRWQRTDLPPFGPADTLP